MRSPASLGAADVIALRAGDLPRLIQVKANIGSAFMNFRPEERAELRRIAEVAGGIAELWHWPPRGVLRVLTPEAWPS